MSAHVPLPSEAPAPAPAGHPWRDGIAVALFALALVAGGAGAWLKRGLATTVFENRPTAPWPARPHDAAQLHAWTRGIEAAVDDRFGGRDRLIRLHHAALALGLAVSPVPKVLIGRDGWLFFRGEDTRAIDRDYRGVVPYAPGEPAAIAAELARRHDALAKLGIAYVVLIAPDKATIYGDRLPAWVHRADATRLDRLFAALATHPQLSVVDVRAALLAAKQQRRVYFRTDSHWNYGGATIAYDVLMQAVARRFPAAPHVPAEQPRYEPGDVYAGDLARMVGVPDALAEDDVLPLRKILGDDSRRCARKLADPVEPVVYGCERPGLPTALVYRDSMFDALIPPVSENFRRVVYHAGHDMTLANVAREHPDVVIEEFVERTMQALIATPLR